MSDELAARVQELEIRFSEQQRLLQDLSDVIVAQERTLDALRIVVARLKDKVVSTPGLADADGDDKPPHY